MLSRSRWSSSRSPESGYTWPGSGSKPPPCTTWRQRAPNLLRGFSLPGRVGRCSNYLVCPWESWPFCWSWLRGGGGIRLGFPDTSLLCLPGPTEGPFPGPTPNLFPFCWPKSRMFYSNWLSLQRLYKICLGPSGFFPYFRACLGGRAPCHWRKFGPWSSFLPGGSGLPPQSGGRPTCALGRPSPGWRNMASVAPPSSL